VAGAAANMPRGGLAGFPAAGVAQAERVSSSRLALAASRFARQVALRAEIDRYFAEVHQPAQPSPPDSFLTELREALPGKYAKQAERIYRRYIESS
jgi:hypothetical protein